MAPAYTNIAVTQPMNEVSDIIVVGAGVAGVSAAFHLAPTASVTVLEAEDAPGYHTSGRSAALFVPSLDGSVVSALVNGSEAFFRSPPDGFADHALLSPRGALTVIGPGEESALETLVEDDPGGHAIDRPEALDLCPAMRPEVVVAGYYRPEILDIDVHGLLQGYLRGFKTAGGRLVTGARVMSLERRDNLWAVETPAGGFAAPLVINAAGAWADVIAEMAGIATLGLEPKRRTVINFEAPATMDCTAFPIIGDVSDSYYFQPEAGGIMASLADETPSPPCDAQPDEIDMAMIVDRMQRATHLDIPRISHSRAGLRSFFADRRPVMGMAPDSEGFFWLAGQGGFGIETSPAMGRIAAALVQGEAFSATTDLSGVTADDLRPDRFTT